MNLTEILKEVREENLSRAQLEKYEMTLSSLYADYQMSIAAGEKAKALFFLAQGQEHPELPDIRIKRIWNGRDEGIDLMTKKIEVKAIAKMLSSVKARIYQQY